MFSISPIQRIGQEMDFFMVEKKNPIFLLLWLQILPFARIQNLEIPIFYSKHLFYDEFFGHLTAFSPKIYNCHHSNVEITISEILIRQKNAPSLVARKPIKWLPH